MDTKLLKPLLDTKEYKLITLENGLRAVLVSDVDHLVTLLAQDQKVSEAESVNTIGGDSDNDSEMENGDDEDDEEEEEEKKAGEKMAACALCVDVGSFSDPPEIPGLAHFLEHMVFMGSTKYPKENALDDFLKKRGGSNNAMTDFENTVFYIECLEIHLAEAMDLFANFFISPLLLKSAMKKERENVHSEFELAVPSDGSRFEQLLGSLAPEGHPGRVFPWGNEQSLTQQGDDELREALEEFRLRHYSAHRMTLAVVGRLPLDTLEDYVRTSFSAIQNNGRPPLDWSQYKGMPWGPDFHKLLWVQPVHDISEVVLTWVLPPMVDEYDAKPLSYLSAIIGHEGPGSLLAYLKTRVLALKSIAGNDGAGFEFNSLFSTLAITLQLTEDGLARVGEVLQAVFSYLAMLRKHLPRKQLFDEYQAISQGLFNYRSEITAYKHAEDLSKAIHMFRPEHLICQDSIYLTYKPKLIRDVVNSLRHDNVNIAIYCKGKPDEIYNREEPWFKTKFRADEIPDEWEKSWASAAPSPEFFLPPANPYVCRKFDLLPGNPDKHPPYPEKLLDTPMLEVWYRQDLKFKQPLAFFNVYISSHHAKSSDVNAAMLDIVANYLENSLESRFYPAREAGYTWQFTASDFGLLMKFSGYDENLMLLFAEMLEATKKVIDELNNPVNQPVFEAVQTELSRSYYNDFLSAADLNKQVRLSVLLEPHWTPMAKLAVVKSVKMEQLQQYCHTFMSMCRVKVLVQGNVTRETALLAGHQVPHLLNLKPDHIKPQARVWKMTPGREVICRVPSIISADSNAEIVNYFQFGPTYKNVKTACIIDLIVMLMAEPLFDSLRTQQQIGYDVSIEPRDAFGVVGFSIQCSYISNRFTPDDIDAAIQKFLVKFSADLRACSAEDFEETKENLAAAKLVMDTALNEELDRNFAEIFSEEYMFDRLPTEVATVKKLTQEEVCDWYDSQIDCTKDMKKLSIQVIHSSSPSSSASQGTFQITPICPDPSKFISDLPEFLKQRELYPPQQPS